MNSKLYYALYSTCNDSWLKNVIFKKQIISPNVNRMILTTLQFSALASAPSSSLRPPGRRRPSRHFASSVTLPPSSRRRWLRDSSRCLPLRLRWTCASASTAPSARGESRGSPPRHPARSLRSLPCKAPLHTAPPPTGPALRWAFPWGLCYRRLVDNGSMVQGSMVHCTAPTRRSERGENRES